MSLFDIFKSKSPEPDNNANSSSNKNQEQQERYALQAFHQLQAETKVPCVKIDLTNTKPDIFQSKVGGMGYIPRDGKFPTDSKGRQLRLLAQIDCSEIQINEYPKEGLLQFWILNDDVCGLNFDDNTKQDTFRIIFHKNIDKSVTEDDIKAKFKENEFDKDDMMPNRGEYGLKFNMSEDSLSLSDCRFDNKFAEQYNQLNPAETIESYGDLDIEVDDIDDNSAAFGHKIGGYPAFTQYDPREESSADNYDFLLLQLDSNYEGDNDMMMWGDSGICNFFISSQKLKNLDFSDVIYNWDCC